ncbi:MAG: TetR/AcrR family transcriptional regulator [Proteobacteria bacterium]|nr:TetR/AcrR family transcriptional regulator [Pseudomonadota bacterium]
MNEQAAMATPGERPGRREQNKAENRAALLKAARTVFAEIGYGAAGVRDIVRRTDLASGTFYNYFKDKEEIFGAVIAELSTELLDRHRQGRVKAKTAEEFFRAHCSVYMNFVAADPEILAFGRNNVAAVRNLFDKPELRELADALNEDIRVAISRGVLPDVDPGFLIAALSGVVFEVSVVMTSRNPVNPTEAADFATRLLMGGIANVPRRAAAKA